VVKDFFLKRERIVIAGDAITAESGSEIIPNWQMRNCGYVPFVRMKGYRPKPRKEDQND
jgi:hypothetical protein